MAGSRFQDCFEFAKNANFRFDSFHLTYLKNPSEFLFSVAVLTQVKWETSDDLTLDKHKELDSGRNNCKSWDLNLFEEPWMQAAIKRHVYYEL